MSVFGPWDEEKGNPSSGYYSVGIGGKENPRLSVHFYKTRVRDVVDDADNYSIIYENKIPCEVFLKYRIQRDPSWGSDPDDLTREEESINRIKLLRRLIDIERQFIGQAAFDKMSS